ncbi:unnamed protein product [Coregonus sp. 'balchen']|nr:unnamed protein product [Coregonus sp. 'balchen']
MEAEGSADEAIKLKVIINDNRIEKVVLPSQPDSLNELISTLKEKLHLKFDFCLLYEDPDFNNELFNLETIEDLPSPRATVHAEFQRITNQSLQQTFYAALDHHTPRLLTLFREKEGKSTTYGGNGGPAQ